MIHRILLKCALTSLVLSFVAFAQGEVGARKATVSACGDERDTIIAEYATYGVSWTPGCDDFSQTAHSDHFTFTEFNSGDYSWAIVKAALTIPETSSYGLERWRKEYGSSRIINSAYRNPKHNSDVGGAKDSRHMYGDASDLRNESRTEDEWTNMQAAATRAQADYIEPRNGPCDIGCVHADWRNTTEQNARERAQFAQNTPIDIGQLSHTANAEERAKTFEDLVRQSNGGQSKRNYDAMAKRIPANASRAFIGLLVNENEFVKSSQSEHVRLSETYTDYYADLIGTVSALRDPASIGALLESAPTGWIAIRGVAQFGATALAPASAMLRDGDVPHRRAAAQVRKTILSGHKLSAADNVTVGLTIKAALDDRDGYTRYAALESVTALDRDDFPAKLRVLEQKDTFQLGNEFPIRKLAAQILRDWGLGAENSSNQKAVRTTGVMSQACAVKKTIWTNSSQKAIVVSGKFEDNCHEPEDQGEVSIFDKSNNQVGTTFKCSKGYWVTVPLTVPAQGHIEYLCHSNSSTQELQCMYEITEPSEIAADKDPCSTVYPIPDGADQWTNCVKSGASACGGPDQCACATSDRLVEYSCSEGKYNKCTTESACSDSLSKR
jgi:hypothetical protein